MKPVSPATLRLVLALEHALGDRLYADLAADDEGGLRLSLEFDIGNVRDLDASDLPASVRDAFEEEADACRDADARAGETEAEARFAYQLTRGV